MEHYHPLLKELFFGVFVSYIMFVFEEPLQLIDILPIKYQVTNFTLGIVITIILLLGIAAYFFDLAKRRTREVI